MAWTDIDDKPSLIRPLLAERGLSLKKRWGQNFMISRRDRERVVSLAGVEPGDTVWEIGSGLGGITALVLDRAREVTVFEVDFGLARIIEERFGDAVRMVHGDAVKTLMHEPLPQRIVGNLPYRSAAAIISSLFERDEGLVAVARMVFTVQKEMAQRMAARPETKEYSPFSVLCQLGASVQLAGDISRGSFYPAPDVTSAIVVLEPGPVTGSLLRSAGVVSRSLFQSRRKTISNNLATLSARSGLGVDELTAAVTACGVSLSARAEELSPDQFLAISQRIGPVGEMTSGQRG